MLPTGAPKLCAISRVPGALPIVQCLWLFLTYRCGAHHRLPGRPI